MNNRIYIPKKVINIYIYIYIYIYNTKLMIGSVELTNNADPDKYK